MFFKKEMTATDYDCDCMNRLRISAAMRYMQQTSSEHLDSLGLPYEKLYQEKMVFLLSQGYIKVYEMPVAGQKIVVGTAAVATKGARFVREFTIEDRLGNRLLSSLTMWLLVDPFSRRILRPSSFPYALDFEESLVSNEIEDVAFPRLLEGRNRTEWEVPIRYSHIDCNNHVNNSIYADFVCDMLPLDKLTQKGLDTLVISYHQEAKYGNTIHMAATAMSDSEYYIVGNREDAQMCFEALAILNEKSLQRQK
ncbi:hypothetical protein LJC63_03030 [Ruminococcaceae bacterium OttesenSCG-928-L11]|nr:hypothetical protein [Ruminococcaceae bacterium OttesenSCG-928-L11]